MVRVFISILLIWLFAALSAPLAFAQISSPTDISNLRFWVDAQDVTATGVQPPNGSTVTQWIDKSGNGNNLTTQAGTITYEAAGFDGLNPGLRFPLVARMAAANPFTGNFQNEMTVFFVNANVTLTRNFSVSLNGTNQGRNIANGRFSFHTPWEPLNQVFFDAGACCGQTRLNAPFPNGATETTLYTGLNDEPGASQLLRVDGQPLDSDGSGHNANVSGGIHIGDLPGGIEYDGRFAEIVIYDRGLSLSEIQDVECYLLRKWKPSAAPSNCAPVITTSKTVTPFENSGAGSYALPGNDVIYTLSTIHEGGPDLDAGTIFLVDKLPAEVIFYNGDIDDGGPEINPVSFTTTGSSLSLNYGTDVGFSNLSAVPLMLGDCNYTPIAGYDPNVTFVCIRPSGIFNSGTPNPTFSAAFRAQIR